MSFELSSEIEKPKEIPDRCNTLNETDLDVSMKMKQTSSEFKPNNVRDEESYSSEVSESTVLYHMNPCDNNERTTDLEITKEDFFSSDIDSSKSESNCREAVSKNEKSKCPKEAKNNQDKENERKMSGGSDPEEKELKKLLRMTEINPNSRSNASDSENGKKVKEEHKERKSLESKKEDVHLLHCLESENHECSGSDHFLEEDKQNDNDFFVLVNSQVKEAFLVSSDEISQHSEEIDNEKSTKTKKEKKFKNKATINVETKRMKRKDDLREFRISNLFSEEEEEMLLEDEISEREILEEKSTEKNLKSKESDDSSEQSEDSVKYIQHVKKRKRMSVENSEQTTDTDSGWEIQPVLCKTESSPTKGRKNIKKILKKEKLQIETKQALKMETERKKRVNERLKVFERLFPNSAADSKLILDFDPQTKEALLVVDEKLSRRLKPHQRDGIRFMWNCCFESLKRLEEDSGSGCVLAHCMGLGKSLQVITLVHTILTQNTGVHTVMVICPLNTIRNWVHEFKKWQRNCQKKVRPVDLIPYKNKHSRMLKVKSWWREGGVLIVSYDMFRSLIKKDNNNSVFSQCFLDPGPDLVVCDEGHVLKNNNSALSRCMSRIKTLRRIILTGTPLQNNLLEYYCMVQFVKPNILGTMKEFKNRFVHPINNGQFEDSTKLDVLLMKRRSHVLHTMLDSFIQRFGYYVLTPFLPEKQEYVISISLTETQENLYRLFVERCDQENRGLLKDFHWLQKIWTHPQVLLKHPIKCEGGPGAKELWSKYVREEECNDIRSSGKVLLLFKILRQSKEIGDKVLLFSQSLLSLDLIEFFLRKAHHDYLSGVRSEFADSWDFGSDYYRLDGSTSGENRGVYCQKFNDPHNDRFRLFLVSTKAGGLGISLVAANRVVVFDASWNPSHDVQSIFRVYRFGQKKPCFIYRFLAAATMEEKIYKRQVTKLSLAHRILDEHQIERHYTMGNLQELYRYDPIPKSEWRIPKIPKDNLFAEILACNHDIIVGYHEHDSLLENKEEEELTEEDRRAAWEDYEKEKLTPEFLLPALNGSPMPLPAINRLHGEGLKVIQKYKQGIDASNRSKLANIVQSENQICKIVDVRMLQKEEFARGNVQIENQRKVAQPFGPRLL